MSKAKTTIANVVRAARPSLALIGASLLLTAVATADEIRVVGHMLPRQSELLPQPIALSEPCDQITIVEWRPTVGAAASTGDSATARKEIDRICRHAFARFQPFLVARRYKLPKSARLRADVSLLPAHLDRGGTDYRSLNDYTYRFAPRSYARAEVGVLHGPAPKATRAYTIAKRSEFVDFEVRAFLAAMNAREPGWGGGSTIGGAPRHADGSRSRLSIEEVGAVFVEVARRGALPTAAADLSGRGPASR